MTNTGFVDYIIDLLSGFRNISARRMFGGYGLYSDKVIFALIIDDELYFKADNDLALEYSKAGSYPFTYQKNDKIVALSYWYVPAEIIENEDSLKDWFDKSLKVSIKSKKK
jgi:DNA transformation protein